MRSAIDCSGVVYGRRILEYVGKLVRHQMGTDWVMPLPWPYFSWARDQAAHCDQRSAWRAYQEGDF